MSGLRRRAGQELELLACAAVDPMELDAALPAHLQRVAGCGPVFMAAVDPVTLHFTRTSRTDISPDAAAEFLAHEIGVADVGKFRQLAVAPQSVETLYRVTDGAPQASARWRDVIEPLGWGDELRVALREGRHTWGFLCLHREAGEPAFTEQDVEAVERVVPALSAAFRRLSSTATAQTPVMSLRPAEPGVILFAEDLSVRSMTDAALVWLDELGGDADAMPLVLTSIVAHALASGRTGLVRISTRRGLTLTLHASPLREVQGAGVAVVLEPASPADALELLAVAVRLTPREIEVAVAISRGLSNRAMARSLRISEHTVQDHLKSIYSKLGVSSRAELAARLLAT